MIKRDEKVIILIKGLIHQQDITIVNIYAPSVRTPKYIKQQLTEQKKPEIQ